MIRYPGSKSKLLEAIIGSFPANIRLQLFANHHGWEYREPFFGSGAVGTDLLKELPDRCKVWVNDKDYWLACMWITIRDEPQPLCEMIEDFEPSAEKFYEFKEQDGSRIDVISAGFKKIALHQMSFGGFGVKAGGPLGGKDGSSEYNPESRWNPESLMLKVARLHRLMKGVKITCKDFAVMFDASPDCFIYCDPPYVDKGPELYKHSFTDEDHRRLAECAKRTQCRWAISYDDHPLVRELYAGYPISAIDVRYSCAVERTARRKNQEVLITNVN